ncbi:Zinc transporter 5, partial [Brachionus plicatilis]
MNDHSKQPRRTSSFALNDVVHLLILLLVSKFLKSFGIYLCYDLLKHIHIVQLLFFSLLIAALFYLLLQRPFSNPGTSKKSSTLSKIQYIRLFKYSSFQVFIKLLWLFGLTQCGPLRTTLIFEQSEFVVLCAIKAIFLSQTNPSRTRGVFLLLVGTLVLFAFDHDRLQAPSDHPEGHHGIISHLFYVLISWFQVSDHKAGIILLVSALFLQIGFNHGSLTKVLITDLGGHKRLKALSTVFSAIIIAPWAIFNLFTNIIDPSAYTSLATEDSELLTSQTEHSWLYYLLPTLLVSLFIYLIDFYVDSYVSNKTESNFAAKHGSIFVFTASVGLSFIWNYPHLVKVMVMDKIKTIIEQEHALSWGVIIAYFLFVIATHSLSSPLISHKGSFIGYSSVGSPLYSLTGENLKKTSMSMVTVTKNILREIISNTDSRKIFYFLCLNLMFTFVELTYGAFTNSLGLISDGFHMLFDCSALVMGLFAAVVSQWKPTRIYSYGFGRVEILSGFINGLFLVVISLFVFAEAFMRLFEPPEIKSEKLIYVSFAGLCVNLFGIFAFSHAHSHGGISDDSHAHSHSHSHGHNHSHGPGNCSSSENDNMRGVYLHVLADTLGSVGVIISSFLIQQFGWYIADPLCSLCISIMIFLSVLPLLKHSSSVLLLRTPENKEKQFKNLVQKILNVEGVLSYRDDHLWQLSSNNYVASLHVQISQDAYEQLVSSQIHSILKELKLNNLTLQIEKKIFFQHLQGLGANLGQIDNANVVYRQDNLNR